MRIEYLRKDCYQVIKAVRPCQAEFIMVTEDHRCLTQGMKEVYARAAVAGESHRVSQVREVEPTPVTRI